MLVYDSSLDNQHSTARKFSRRWFGPYVIKKVEDNATFRLLELDGTPHALLIAGKRIKIFKRRDKTEIGIEALDDDVWSIENEVAWINKWSPHSSLAHTGGCAGLVGVNVV